MRIEGGLRAKNTSPQKGMQVHILILFQEGRVAWRRRQRQNYQSGARTAQQLLISQEANDESNYRYNKAFYMTLFSTQTRTLEGLFSPPPPQFTDAAQARVPQHEKRNTQTREELRQ